MNKFPSCKCIKKKFSDKYTFAIFSLLTHPCEVSVEVDQVGPGRVVTPSEPFPCPDTSGSPGIPGPHDKMIPDHTGHRYGQHVHNFIFHHINTWVLFTIREAGDDNKGI